MANEQCNEKLTFLIHSCFWIETYFAIWRKIKEASQEEYLKYYPELSMVITKALVDSSIIALSRIYDTHKDSTVDIYSLLNSINSDESFIDSDILI